MVCVKRWNIVKEKNSNTNAFGWVGNKDLSRTPNALFCICICRRGHHDTWALNLLSRLLCMHILTSVYIFTTEYQLSDLPRNATVGERTKGISFLLLSSFKANQFLTHAITSPQSRASEADPSGSTLLPQSKCALGFQTQSPAPS